MTAQELWRVARELQRAHIRAEQKKEAGPCGYIEAYGCLEAQVEITLTRLRAFARQMGSEDEDEEQE